MLRLGEENYGAECTPTPMEYTGVREGNWPDCGKDIFINKVVNGVVVKVGCKHFVFNNIDEMLTELRKYLIDPVKTEKEYIEKYRTK